jgi:hypothetical protein
VEMVVLAKQVIGGLAKILVLTNWSEAVLKTDILRAYLPRRGNGLGLGHDGIC